MTPPPTSQPKSLLLVSSNPSGEKSARVLMRPTPARAYGRIGPILGTIMTLPMSVNKLDDNPSTLPKKSSVYENSVSNPRTGPMAPNATPQFTFLSSHSVISRQPESPPKLYPMNGLINPWAWAFLDPATAKASVRVKSVTIRTDRQDMCPPPRRLGPDLASRSAVSCCRP